VKNASKYIRQVYKAALAGITYNTKSVPVYESVTVQTLPDYFIEIVSVDENNTLNDAKFIREVTVTVEVFTRQYQYQDNAAVDEIAEDAMNAIIPNVGGSLTNADFQIGHVQLESTRYLNERGSNGEFITRKILIFNQSLIQF